MDEIHELKAQLEAAKERIAALETFVNLAPGVLYSIKVDAAGNSSIPYANQKIEDIYGLSREEMQKDASVIFSSIAPEDLAGVQETFSESMRSLQPFRAEFRILNRQSGMRWVESYAIPERKEDGSTLWHGFMQDVTERRHDMNMLRASEENYRSLVENSRNAIAVISRDGQVLFANPAGIKLWGNAQVVGKSIYELFPEQFAQRYEAAIKNVIDNKVDLFDEASTVLNGKPMWFALNMCPIREPDGTVRALMLSAWDMTDRKETEDALRAREAQYRLLAENMNETVWMMDMNFQYIYASPSVSAVRGYSIEELNHLPLEQQMSQESYLRAMQAMAQILDPDNLQSANPLLEATLELEIFSKNGLSRWSENHFLLVLDENKQPRHIIGTGRDISERRQAIEQNRIQAAALQAAANAIMITDHKGCIQWVNPAWSKLHGYTLEEVQGKMPRAIQSGMNDEGLYETLWETITSGETWQGELVNQHKDGTYYHVDETITPVRDAAGNITHFVGIMQNITERKQAEEALREKEENFRLFAESMDEVFWMEDMQARKMIYVSPGFERVWGRPVLQLYEERGIFLESIVPEDHKRVIETLELQNSGVIFSHEYRIRRPNGELRVIWDSAYPVRDKNGKLIRYVGVAQDITERKQAEMDLRESEEKYRVLMQSFDSAIATISYEGEIFYMNEVGAQMLGMHLEDIVGRNLHEVLPEPFLGRALNIIRETMQKNAPSINEFADILPGELHWYRVSLQPLHNEMGEATSVFINLTDIDSLKTAQKELLELNHTLEQRVNERTAEVRDLYDYAPTGYHSLDSSGNFVMINQTELDWLGYAREEILGQPFTRFTTPEGLSVFAENFPILKREGRISNIEFEFVRKDGTSFPGMLNATAIYDSNGDYLMSRSTLFDISDRVLAERAMRESEETYRALFENANDAIFLMQPNMHFVRVNSRCEDLLGYSAEELIGRDALDFIVPQAIPEAYNHLDHLFAGEYINAYERKFRRKDGKEIETEVHLSLIRDAQGQPKLIQSVVRDITKRKQAEETLRLANMEMERALRMKDEFLANMSHELRTPLNAILGISESMAEQLAGPLTDKQLRYIRTIHESGHHLLQLINDILDLSKLEAGKISLNMVQISIPAVCEASLRLVREQSIKKRQTIHLNIDASLSTFSADERRLKQMLVNLLSNAVKFTPEDGQLGLTVSVGEHREHIDFTVWDAGIGIAPEDLKRLFQPFMQLDAGLTRGQSGTGLGLVLVAEMARLHGGRVSVESQPGKGSQFTIILPMQGSMQTKSLSLPADSAPSSPGLITPPEGRPGKILLVEDTETVSMVIQDYLNSIGYETILARDGLEGVEQAKRTRPDLILMDVQMPIMDGIEATKKIRAEASTATIPIVALTALAMIGDRERCIEAGMNEYLSKPVQLKLLSETIEQVLRERKESAK